MRLRSLLVIVAVASQWEVTKRCGGAKVEEIDVSILSLSSSMAGHFLSVFRAVSNG